MSSVFSESNLKYSWSLDPLAINDTEIEDDP